MCMKALEWARRQRTGSPTLKAVLKAVADYADEDGRSWPSQIRLAHDTELSERSVRESLRTLEERGYLNRIPHRRPDNSRSTDTIELRLDRPVDQPQGDQCVADGVPAASSGTQTHQAAPAAGTVPAAGSGCTGSTFRYSYRQQAPEVPAGGAGLTTFEPPSNHQGYLSSAQRGVAPDRQSRTTGITDAEWHETLERLIAVGVGRTTAKQFLGKCLRSLRGRSGDLVTAVAGISEDLSDDPLADILRALAIEEPVRQIKRKGKADKNRKFAWPANFVDAFWSMYPRKTDKSKSIRVLEFIYKSDKVDFDDIASGVRNMIDSGLEITFMPHATTFLRNERWNDVWPKKAQAPKGGSARRSHQDDNLELARQAHLRLTGGSDDEGPFDRDADRRFAGGGYQNGYAGSPVHEPAGERLRLAPPGLAGPPRPH